MVRKKRSQKRLKRKAYDPPGMPPTLGRFSQIVRSDAVSMLYIAGQVSVDSAGNLIGKGDFKAQAKQALENLGLALKAEGADFTDIVKLNTYVTDISKVGELHEVRSAYLSKDPPAATLVAVPALVNPDYMIEIEAIAALD